MVGGELLRHKKNQLYLVADMETEGLNLFYTRPFQLAFVLGEGDTVKEKFNQYIRWPDINVSEGAARATNFNLQKYNAEAKDPSEILETLEKYLYNDKYVLAAHNWLGYDAYIHNTWRRLLGKKTNYSYLNKLIDTNCLAKAIKLGVKLKEGEDKLLFQYRLFHHKQKGLKSSLSTCCKDYGIPYDEELLHDALYDIELNYLIWNKQKWLVEI